MSIAHHKNRMALKERQKAKEEFLVKHFAAFERAIIAVRQREIRNPHCNNHKSDTTLLEVKEFVKLARKELNYSSSTVPIDIWNKFTDVDLYKKIYERVILHKGDTVAIYDPKQLSESWEAFKKIKGVDNPYGLKSAKEFYDFLIKQTREVVDRIMINNGQDAL